MNTNVNVPPDSREIISALADGRLHGEEFAGAMSLLARDADALSCWHSYHVIGDVLRSTELGVRAGDTAMLAGLRARMQTEPALLAGLAPGVTPLVAGALSPQLRAGPANDASMRWKLVAGFASMAAVAAIGWTVVSTPGPDRQAPVLAQQSAAGAVQQAVVLPGGEQQVMIRDARLDELLAAHKQFGGTSALQKPAGFLRNATFEGPAR